MKNVLTVQQQDMAIIACLEAKGDLAKLSKAIDKGLDDGLTVSQVKEALSQLYAYTGFPRSLNALGTLQKYKQGTLHMVKHLDLIDTDPLNPLMNISSEIADK